MTVPSEPGNPQTVMTVSGPIPVADLGLTLIHEHALLDSRDGYRPPPDGDDLAHRLARSTVSPELRSALRQNPLGCLDNLLLDDEDVATEELGLARAAGVATLVDATNKGCGRDPRALLRLSERTGLQVVMGSGYYLERSHPPYVSRMDVAEIAKEISDEFTHGADGTAIRPGVIGEIGVSAALTTAELKVLRASGAAQLITGAPLLIHLPAWHRMGGLVLDHLEEVGVSPDAVVLCHMNPSGEDWRYQHDLALRGAWLGYDMIGNSLQYPDLGSSPDDLENARAILHLLEAGFGDQVLLSGDVGQKNMLRRNGGPGYGYVVDTFLPLLAGYGVDLATRTALVKDNPRRLFEIAGKEMT